MNAARPLALASLLLTFAAAPLCAADKPADNGARSATTRTCGRIFQQHCQGCHQPAKPLGGFVMTELRRPAQDRRAASKAGVVPGKPDESYLVEQITPHDGKKPRCPSNATRCPTARSRSSRSGSPQGAKDDTPAADRVVIDAEHPPVYELPPVITSLDLLARRQAARRLRLSRSPAAQGRRLRPGRPAGRPVGAHPVAGVLAGRQVPGRGRRLAGPLRRSAGLGRRPKKKLKLSRSVTFDTLYGVSWSPDGTKIAFGCADNTVRAIDAATGKQVLYQGAAQRLGARHRLLEGRHVPRLRQPRHAR